MALEHTEANGLGSPLPWLSSLGSYPTWVWPGDLGRRLAFLLDCWFSWDTHHSQGQTFPGGTEADKSNLSSKQVMLLQNLRKVRGGTFPLAWNFKLLWVQSHCDFLQGGLRAKKDSFLSLIEYPSFQPQSDHSENTPSSFYQLKPGIDMWCVKGSRLLFSASGISC